MIDISLFDVKKGGNQKKKHLGSETNPIAISYQMKLMIVFNYIWEVY